MTLTNLKISPTSIGNQIGQIKKNSVIRSYRKPLEPGLKLKIQLLAELCPPSVWHKICWYRWTISLSFKPTTHRNLKHKVPNVRALSISFYLLFTVLVLHENLCLSQTQNQWNSLIILKTTKIFILKIPYWKFVVNDSYNPWKMMQLKQSVFLCYGQPQLTLHKAVPWR